MSVSRDGGQADGFSSRPALSQDARYVVFESAATDIIAGDANRSTDIFRRGPLR